MGNYSGWIYCISSHVAYSAYMEFQCLFVTGDKGICGRFNIFTNLEGSKFSHHRNSHIFTIKGLYFLIFLSCMISFILFMSKLCFSFIGCAKVRELRPFINISWMGIDLYFSQNWLSPCDARLILCFPMCIIF